MTDFNDESKHFSRKFRPLKVIEPFDFLKIVEEKTKKNLVIES